MEWIVPYIWAAGGLQLMVASANVFAARMFRYRESLRTLPGHVAEVFVVQNIFIMLTVVGMAVLCFGFAEELAGGQQFPASGIRLEKLDFGEPLGPQRVTLGRSSVPVVVPGTPLAGRL